MGSDILGNKYYVSNNKLKRWVIYGKENYASELSIEWHGWIHWTTDSIPLKARKGGPGQGRVFERKEHIPFISGKLDTQKDKEYEPWIPM